MPASTVRDFSSSQLRNVLKRRKTKPRAVALLMGLSQQTVSAWVNGRYGPSPAHLLRLADVLGVPVDEFLTTTADEDDLAGLRQRKGLTVTEFAEELGLYKAALSDVENGLRQVPDRARTAMAERLGVTADQLDAAWQRGHAAATRRARK